ncbi:hypothetical protein MBELCI_2048 [Limimaricola cinnabarinus LL-001]|uniref:Uncharacterized protein n=1 Tax=Limimaricola cinnabarinus LL-001 TaxID=1337093 RepID=U2YLL9_9RHOB|nr:hypothetical protein MBELCI_2048 [Limimaricola cinnabarinus LL-001]
MKKAQGPLRVAHAHCRLLPEFGTRAAARAVMAWMHDRRHLTCQEEYIYETIG